MRVLSKAYLGDKWAGKLNSVYRGIQELCGGYCFSHLKVADSERLYNPLLVYRYLNKLKYREGSMPEPGCARLYSNCILRSVVDTRSRFSIGDIIQLASTGSLKSEITERFKLTDIETSSGKDNVVTLSLLAYIGLVTRSVNNPGVLEITNDAMRNIVC
jgi:hypothetical protein